MAFNNNTHKPSHLKLKVSHNVPINLTLRAEKSFKILSELVTKEGPGRQDPVGLLDRPNRGM